jgi:hypothetical protein
MSITQPRELELRKIIYERQRKPRETNLNPRTSAKLLKKRKDPVFASQKRGSSFPIYKQAEKINQKSYIEYIKIRIYNYFQNNRFFHKILFYIKNIDSRISMFILFIFFIIYIIYK